MSETIKQSYGLHCFKCDRIVMEGSLYLHSAGFGSWNYCKYCAVKIKGYDLEDFKNFRPEADPILICYKEFNQVYGIDRPLGFSLWSVK